MQNNLPKIPLLLSLIFFVLSCFIFAFFYWAINNNNEESQTKEEKWRNETLRREEIKTLDRSIELIEAERIQLETHFAKSSDIVPFLDTIEKLAGKVKTRAEVVSVDILGDNAGLLVIMKASGTFNDLYRLLTLLENSPYELEFVEMNMERETTLDTESKKTVSPKWNVTFKMKLLSFVQ